MELTVLPSEKSKKDKLKDKSKKDKSKNQKNKKNIVIEKSKNNTKTKPIENEQTVKKKPSFIQNSKHQRNTIESKTKINTLINISSNITHGSCVCVSCRYIDKQNQIRHLSPKHVILGDDTNPHDFKMAYEKTLKSKLANSEIKLFEVLDVTVVPCKTCHSKKCYYVSFSFTDQKGEFRYYEPHHFLNDNETLTKDNITIIYKNKIAEWGGKNIDIRVDFCCEDQEMTFVENFLGWLFFG